MVKISYTLNVGVPLAVIGCCGLCIVVTMYVHVFLQIGIGSIRRKTSRNTQWSVCVELPVSQLVEWLTKYSSPFPWSLNAFMQLHNDSVTHYDFIRRAFSLAVHTYHSPSTTLWTHSSTECFRHEFEKLLKLQLDRCYRQSTALKCQPKHR
jgi:hypothetical protein